MTHRLASVSAAIAFALVAIGAAGTAHAQAWVSDQGALDLDLDYNLGISDKVVADKGPDFKDAGSTTHQFTLGAAYTPIQHLAVEASLPLVLLKYTGNKTLYPHGPLAKYDDGNTHATLTDLRAGVRYGILEDPLALSVHVAGSIPVADYATVGNTVAGRHLKQLHLGASVGKFFGESSYANVTYEFSLVEKYDANADTKKYGQNHSDLAVTLGHFFLLQKLNVHVDFNGHWTHGGFEFSQFGTAPADVLAFHDPVLDEDQMLVGGGVGYQLSNKLAVNIGGRLFVSGRNTQNASVFALGFAYSPL